MTNHKLNKVWLSIHNLWKGLRLVYWLADLISCWNTMKYLNKPKVLDDDMCYTNDIYQ